MLQDHRACDDLFAAAENAASGAELVEWEQRYVQLKDALERHFRMEEEVLFPAFEERSGMTSGPTAVMRSEHDQMRELLARLGESVTAKDVKSYLGLAETLMIFMQQHNIKEENVLYPMADRSLAERAEELVGDMSALG
jgi:iron-sulfur cluster repair protein YtfE (RIC family)